MCHVFACPFGFEGQDRASLVVLKGTRTLYHSSIYGYSDFSMTKTRNFNGKFFLHGTEQDTSCFHNIQRKTEPSIERFHVTSVRFPGTEGQNAHAVSVLTAHAHGLSEVTKFLCMYSKNHLTGSDHIQYICGKILIGVGVPQKIFYPAIPCAISNCNIVWEGT